MSAHLLWAERSRLPDVRRVGRRPSCMEILLLFLLLLLLLLLHLLLLHPRGVRLRVGARMGLMSHLSTPKAGSRRGRRGRS